MEPQTFDFKPEEPNLSREMRAALANTEAALNHKWALDAQDERTVYEISIPVQTLTIVGKERAERTLRALKGMKVSGTYRITRK